MSKIDERLDKLKKLGRGQFFDESVQFTEEDTDRVLLDEIKEIREEVVFEVLELLSVEALKWEKTSRLYHAPRFHEPLNTMSEKLRAHFFQREKASCTKGMIELPDGTDSAKEG